MLLKMAWRNLWRSRRRTLITCFSVGFGFFLALSLTGMAEDSYKRTIDTGATMGAGHVTVQPVGYDEKPGLDRRIDGAGAIRDAASALSQVRAANTRITGQAMFAAGGRTRGGQLIAIDPAHESGQDNLFIKHLVDGAVFTEIDGRGALVGDKMMERLKLKLGRKLIYTVTDVNGEIVSDVVRVQGVFHTGIDEVDGGVAVIPLDRARQTLGYGPDEATMVAVVLHQQRDTDAVHAALTGRATPGSEALTWRQTQADLAGLLAVDRATNQLFQLLVGLLIGAGVLNTLYMSVMERRREFGVMMAIGMSPWSLFAMILAESALIAVVGIALGGLATVPWYHYMTQTGIDMSAYMGAEYDIGGVAVDPIIRLFLPFDVVFGITATLLFLTLLSGMYPAWVAGRVAPVESLRTV